MTNSIAPQIYRPPWVEARIDAFRRMTAGGLADASTEPTSVTTFHNMTPQSAARRLERIRAADALTITADAVQSMLSPAQSKLTFVDEPIGEYHKPSTRQKLPAPSPPAPQQSGVDQLPPVVNPNVPRPTQWDGPLPELPSQQNDESGATPSPTGTTPIPVLPEPAPAEDASEHVFGLPDVAGHAPGDTWDETLPNGITRTNTIPFGNGLNTVDQVIHNADGTITYSRVVSDGRGGYQRWNNDSTGTASYYNSGDPGAMGFGQHFMPGTSTSGAPDREFGTTPGWAEVVSPSYDADGNLVGYDVGVPNAEGLYDNIHYDNYGNRTVTTAAPNGHGGVTSRFFEQVDSEGNGWRIGPDDERWTMALDSHGNPVTMRTRDDEDGVLLSRIDHTGLRTDEFRGVDGEWFRDTTTPDGRITRLLRDFTRITFDADGAEIARQGRPDTRAAWEKAAGFGLAFGKGVANGALGLVELAGALSGVNAQINLVGELFGKIPNLTTLPEAVIGLGRTVVDVAVADYRAWTTTSSELGAFLSGEQGWDETWDEASRAIGNSYNEMSKLVIGTDWTGFSEHPAETLGNAAFGIATFFVPAKGLGGAGRGGRAGGILAEAPSAYRTHRTDVQKPSADSRATNTRRGLEFAPAFASQFTRWPKTMRGRAGSAVAPSHTTNLLGKTASDTTSPFTRLPGRARDAVAGEVRFWGEVANEVKHTVQQAMAVFAGPDAVVAGNGRIAFDRVAMVDTPGSLGRGQSAGRPSRNGGEVGSGRPTGEPVTIYLWREEGMPKAEFRRKAQALVDLGEEGALFKAKSVRDRNITKKYRQDIIDRIYAQYNHVNPQFSKKLIDRVTRRMQPDHVHELQLGGLDAAVNLKFLDTFTNWHVGTRQIRPQIRNLPDGTRIRIEVLKW